MTSDLERIASALAHGLVQNGFDRQPAVRDIDAAPVFWFRADPDDLRAGDLNIVSRAFVQQSFREVDCLTQQDRALLEAIERAEEKDFFLIVSVQQQPAYVWRHYSETHYPALMAGLN